MTNQMPERIYIGMDGRWHKNISDFDDGYRGHEYVKADLAQKTVTREELVNTMGKTFLEGVKGEVMGSLFTRITDALIQSGIVKVKD